MSAPQYNGGINEWQTVHQPFELNYHRHSNFRWPGQEAVWQEQWDNVFGFAGLNPKSFTSEHKLLDMGCGSKPALEWFIGGEKWCMDPLLNDFREIPQVQASWDALDPARLIAKPGEEFIPELSGTFDFILCWNALDHAYDAQAVLRHIYSYAKPGAVILLGTDTGDKPHLGHPGIGSRQQFMATVRELFEVEKETNSGFRYCRQKAFVLHKRAGEIEKYQGIYANPSAYRGYGHSNHGRGAAALMEGIKSLCDIGCGHNEFVKTQRTLRADMPAVGVDFACPGADVQAAATALPFVDKQWDMLTSFDMLEHLLPEEVGPALREFARVSSRFCFSICYRASVITWQGANLHPTVQPESWWVGEISRAGGVNIRKVGNYLTGDWCISRRKLTIGMLCYDDFDGVYFSIQSIRLHHPEIMDEVEFLILDNNPSGAHGKAVKSLTDWITDAPLRYVPVENAGGTALRDRIFKLASTPFVLCMDCHVLFAPGALRQLIDYMSAGYDNGNLLQGPMLYDSLKIGATHMEPVWRDGMWGIWAVDERASNPAAEPFEIPAHGLGVFACRKGVWPGFNECFRGFGGEECYIHEKFRRNGHKTLCLPALRWLHRFPRPSGIPYVIKWNDRIHNYLVGHEELGLDPAPVCEHFSQLLKRPISANAS